MKKTESEEKRLEFNLEKVSDTHEKIIEVFQEAKLTVGEILVLYGNLGYTLGASIEGFKDKGPAIEELQKKYYTSPSPGIALMLQGAEITTWYGDWEKIQLGKTEEN